MRKYSLFTNQRILNIFFEWLGMGVHYPILVLIGYTYCINRKKFKINTRKKRGGPGHRCGSMVPP